MGTGFGNPWGQASGNPMGTGFGNPSRVENSWGQASGIPKPALRDRKRMERAGDCRRPPAPWRFRYSP